MNKIILLLFATLNLSIKPTSNLTKISILVGGLIGKELLLKFISKEINPKKIKEQSKYTLMPLSTKSTFNEKKSYRTIEDGLKKNKSNVFLSSYILIIENSPKAKFILEKNKNIEELKIQENKEGKKFGDTLNYAEIASLKSEIENSIIHFNKDIVFQNIIKYQFPINNDNNVYFQAVQNYIVNLAKEEIKTKIEIVLKEKSISEKRKSNEKYNKSLRKKFFKLISRIYFSYIIYHFFIKKGPLKNKKLDSLIYFLVIFLNEKYQKEIFKMENRKNNF